MNAAIAMKPHIVEFIPLVMLSAPKLGPITRSSINDIGAAIAPERIKIAKVLVSSGVKLPVI